MTKKKKDLEDNIELCSQKLDRAEKLIHGLGGERDRWSVMASNLGTRLLNITGDVLLSAGTVAYLGAFDVVYRSRIVREWQQNCTGSCKKSLLVARVDCHQMFRRALPRSAQEAEHSKVVHT